MMQFINTHIDKIVVLLCFLLIISVASMAIIKIIILPSLEKKIEQLKSHRVELERLQVQRKNPGLNVIVDDGPFQVGDYVYDLNGDGKRGWECVESGSPGKWEKRESPPQ